MLTRRIGKFLRGQATPFQVGAAALFGAWIGFAPVFSQAPGWILLLVFGLLSVNANFAVVAVAAATGRLASWALVPLSFEVGRVLLDGPTQPLFRAIVNAPVLAFFGFERYVTAGGLVVGAAYGVLLGLVMNRGLASFRRKMRGLEETSPRYNELVAKRWVKLARFVFVGGGKGKQSYDDLLERRVGNPVRVAGVVGVLLIAAGLFALRDRWTASLLTERMRAGLERANGATVDIAGVELDLAGGRLTLHGLACADPSALDTDLLRVETLEADLATADLLRGRLAFELVLCRNARSGVKRAQPGVRSAHPDAASSEPDSAAGPEERTLEDWLREAETWRERLALARSWSERLAKVGGPGESGESGESSSGREREAEESLSEGLARRARELGYACVLADHLLVDAPWLWIGELRIEGLEATWLPGERLDVRAAQLSSQPALVDAAPTIEVRAQSDRLALFLGLDSTARGTSANRIAFHCKDLQVDQLLGRLRFAGQAPIAGGTLDIALDGAWGSAAPGATAGAVGMLDLPLRVELSNSVLSLPGLAATPVERFELPIALRGPLDAPLISIDDELLVSELLAAGAQRFESELRARAEEQLVTVSDELKSELTGELSEGLAELAERLPDLPRPEGPEGLGAGAGMTELGEELELRTGGIVDRFKRKQRD